MCWAQGVDMEALENLNLRWFLARAVDGGDVSPSGAEAIALHVSQHGAPQAPEEAWRVEGLSPRERDWLAASEEWHELCRWTAPSRRRSIYGSHTATRNVGSEWSAKREWRWHAGSIRGQIQHADSLKASGSWKKTGRGWTWVLGDHALNWGQGLTVPRSDPFGLAVFLGSSELRLPAPPSSLYHSDFAGGFRGMALEHAGLEWTAGVSIGREHTATAIRRSHLNHEWGWSLYMDEVGVRWGFDWTGRLGLWDGQAALARTLQTTSMRASLRKAHSPSWMVQVGADLGFSEGHWEGEVRGYSTWISPSTGGHVLLRVRAQHEEGWDLRLQGKSKKEHPLRWSFWGSAEEHVWALQANGEGVRGTLWAGRDATNAWSFARHVEAHWTWRDGGSFGMFGLAGETRWEGAYVALPSLDRRQWSRAPSSGAQMGLWIQCPSRKLQASQSLQWRSTWQWTWSPSQQVAFRCAWRVRWEA